MKNKWREALRPPLLTHTECFFKYPYLEFFLLKGLQSPLYGQLVSQKSPLSKDSISPTRTHIASTSSTTTMISVIINTLVILLDFLKTLKIIAVVHLSGHLQPGRRYSQESMPLVIQQCCFRQAYTTYCCLSPALLCPFYLSA